MATMGLRINQPSGGVDSSGLADTFAKALFGDPEREMKLARMRSDMDLDAYRQQQIESATAQNAAQTAAIAAKAARDQQERDIKLDPDAIAARQKEILAAQALDDGTAPVAVDPTAPIPVPYGRPDMVDPMVTAGADAPVPVSDDLAALFTGPMSEAPIVPPLPGELPPPPGSSLVPGPAARSDPSLPFPLAPDTGTGDRLIASDMPAPIEERFGAPGVDPLAERFGGPAQPPLVSQPYSPMPDQPPAPMPVPVATADEPAALPPPTLPVQATEAPAAQAAPLVDPNAAIMPDATGAPLPAGAPTQPVQVMPGEAIPHPDGSVTVGTAAGPQKLTPEEAAAVARAAALNNDPAGQTGREAANAGFLFNPNLGLTPAQRVEAAGTGKAPDRGSVSGTDEAIRFERNKDTPEKAAADLAKVQAEADAAAQKGEQDLRKEYTGRDETTKFVVIRDRYKDMETALQRKNGFGDTTAIYAYIKMLDPTSSVMSGEQTTATNAPGMAESTRAYVNSLLTDAKGGKYTDTGRAQLLAEGRSIYGRSAEEQRKLNEVYRQSAEKHNIDPNLVLIPVDPLPAVDTPGEPQATPATEAAAAPAAADETPPAGWTAEQWAEATDAEKRMARGQ